MVNGTQYREVATGIVAKRGKREVYLLGTAVASIERSRQLLATKSFDRLFRAGRKTPATGRNVAYLRIGAA